MRLTLGQIAGLSLVALTLGAGQLLFKLAASRLVVDGGLSDLLASFLSFHLLLALCLYGVATLAWIYLLHGVPLTVAYPFVALALASVPILSWFFLGETISLKYFAGLTLILGGLYIIVRP